MRKTAPTRLDRTEAYFRARPLRWIDGVDLEKPAGRYAWRSRVSDCRTQRGMVIEQRERWKRDTKTAKKLYVISEYRFVPNV